MDFPSIFIYLAPIIAVWAGFGFVRFAKPADTGRIKLLLAFSGAFLLALTFFELLPEVYEGHDPKTIALYILGGILLQIFLEFFSKGAEHGHLHIDLKENRFPLLLFLSLSVHALVEGVPIHGNNSILYGIIIHKVPIAIVLSIFLLNSKMKLGTILLFMAAFSLMTPLGSFVSAQSEWMESHGHLLTSLAIGVFFHISTIILFESAQGHAFNLRKLLVIILGIGIAYFV
ncbi:ZIP family metal transporter [Flagellimonas taeanensis]|uniref:ZIP Zinc transporter n=1 Tax=Flagellimonas taeanensis TaxID=1005926 RepID=A0A1M7C805_9FLAO|nr:MULTISPECIES: ZIP family metal transporter [Allomuricauda]MDC6386890.1 ZIP family metal transporter [Muricauda sp. SK9]RIV50610.1 ZIP family metal transporter [Allomuricauda taeanensis]SFC60975.1 ZIP Zinc transporter [Allomuricauda taeanensis]SHL63297.1 ZIP Zinc transporter [Allomuricauda taeanensis]